MATTRTTRRTRFSRATTPTQPKRGDDGLTDTERAQSAARWNTGAGATPSPDQMKRLRDLTNSSRPTGSTRQTG